MPQEEDLTDTQLYLVMGIPSFIALMGIFVNTLMFISLNSRMSSLETRMLALEQCVHQRFGLLIGKVAALDTRLSVLKTA